MNRLYFILFFVMPVCFPYYAFGHSVYISAWVEGDRVCTESSFSTKSYIKKGKVTVVDSKGKVIQEGVTDNEGNLCLPIPKFEGDELTYVVNAGQGHRAETVLHSEDFTESAEDTPASEKIIDSNSSPKEPTETKKSETIDQEVLAKVVRAELQKQISPIRQTLTIMQQKKPGIQEILGGIGWIFGLVGVALLFGLRGRKR